MIKNKKDTGLGDVIYGFHPVIELLKAKRRKILALYTTKPEPKQFKMIKQLLPKYPVSIAYVSRDRLASMAGSSDHQSIVAVAAPFAYQKKFFDPSKQPFLVLLDGIQDVRNLGAILRSAYCTGVDGVIITQKKSAPLAAATLKASAGLAEHLNIYSAPSAQAAIMELKQAGYTPYITTFSGKNALQVSYKEPLCVVIGSEDTGVTSSIMKEGVQITIPQRAGDISYNASVAAGIILFIVSQRAVLRP